MTIEQFTNVLNMLISGDKETFQLACSIIAIEYSQYLSYNNYCRSSYCLDTLLYSDLLKMYVDWYAFQYANYLRKNVCPFIVYSPYRKMFL